MTKSHEFEEKMLQAYKLEQQINSSDENENPMENVHKYEKELVK